MKCPSCGWPHPPGTAICRCGTSLANAPRSAIRPAQKPVAATPRSAAPGSAKVRSPTFYLGLGAVTLTLGIVNAFIQEGIRLVSAFGGIFIGLSFLGKGFRAMNQASGSSSRQGVLWHAPWLAFHSGDFYDDVGRRGRGVGALYLFGLECVTWLILMIGLYTGFQRYVGNQGQRLIAQVPPIAIKKGKVQVDAPQPYFIRFEENNKAKAMALDTTGEIQNLEARPDLMLLLTADKVHVRQSSGGVRIHDLSQTESFVMDQAILRSWIDRYTVPCFALGWLLMAGGAFVYRLVQALLYAAIGLGFASMFGKSLDYGASFRLSIAAVTPVIILDTMLSIARVPAAGFLYWLFCLAATLGLLAFGVKSLSDD